MLADVHHGYDVVVQSRWRNKLVEFLGQEDMSNERTCTSFLGTMVRECVLYINVQTYHRVFSNECASVD